MKARLFRLFLLIGLIAPAVQPNGQWLHDHGTVYVVIFDRGRITIASDSRVTTSGCNQLTYRDGIEKVKTLNGQQAFFVTGLDGIYHCDRTLELSLDSIALKLSQANQPSTLADRANRFREEVQPQLDNLSQDTLLNIYKVSQEMGQENVFEAVFAGVDKDGVLKMITLAFNLVPRQQGLIWTSGSDEEMVTTERHMSFLGQTQPLKEGLNNPLSAIGALPEFQHWFSSYKKQKRLDPVDASEALLSLDMKYLPEKQREGVGYPIFVYQIDNLHGLRKVRTVRAGHAAVLPH